MLVTTVKGSCNACGYGHKTVDPTVYKVIQILGNR